MGVVIKKLIHPYNHAHKNYNKNGWGFFVWFPRERERERERLFEFLKVFFYNFLTGL